MSDIDDIWDDKEDPKINYQDLLVKYMTHIGIQEGTYFIGESLSHTPVDFTVEEKNKIRELGRSAEEMEEEIWQNRVKS